MGFSFDGYVLRGPRISPVNSKTTGEPWSGVVRDARLIPQNYTLNLGGGFVDAAADQYRAAILEAPGTTATEYLVWAQNTSQLALIDDVNWWSEKGLGTIPTGILQVADASPPVLPSGVPIPAGYGFFFDGSSRFVATDNGNKSIGSFLAVVLARGDINDYDDDGWVDKNNPSLGRKGDKPYMVVILTTADQDTVAGIVSLTRASLKPLPDGITPVPSQVLTELGGGLSRLRGDSVVTVRYTVAPVKFWWTRNDRYETRFGWNGETQRWEPWKGSAPQNVGRLLFDKTYTVTPRIKNLPINSYLPGDAGVPDKYAMVRVGSSPGATGSLPVAPDSTGASSFLGILIRSDTEVSNGFDFNTAPFLSGVVGQTNGILELNPAYVKLHAGKTIWYVYSGFSEDSTGVVGKLKGADSTPLYLAPVPVPQDFPFIRLGNRTYLTPTMFSTEALMDVAGDPATREVHVALSTGRIRLASIDVKKADPKDATFDKNFLGEEVVYDGVALNRVAQPTRAPVALVNEVGAVAVVGTDTEFYVPDAEYLPTPAIPDAYRGLGLSGILDAPDGTGALPAAGNASVRPGGDTLGTANTGRSRQVTDGVSDLVLFSKDGAISSLIVENYEDDLPKFRFKVRQGQAYIAREQGTQGSRVILSRSDTRRFSGDSLYFLQAGVVPATYTTSAQLVSRNRNIFRFDGTETLYYARDTVSYTWTATNLAVKSFYTPTEVAADIQANSIPAPPAFTAVELNGHVALQGTTSIEIGFGAAVKNLTGAAVLGFVPGWQAVANQTNWLPDSGVTVGLYRSPVNLDRSQDTADFKAIDRVSTALLTNDIQPAPYQFLDNVPLQDVAGFDEGVFFNLMTLVTQGDTTFILNKPLVHYTDIVHRFSDRRFEWVERGTKNGSVQSQTAILTFDKASVVPESLLGATGIGGGLYTASAGGVYTLQDQDNDYVLPQDGVPGQAFLIERFGKRVQFGGLGNLTLGSGVFTDTTAEFQTGTYPVAPGHRLKVTSGDEKVQGSYTVVTVDSDTQLTVSPPALLTPIRPVTWEAYAGYTQAVYDPAVVADQVFKEFNHLEVEPFKIRLLDFVGLCPADAAAQTASPLQADMEAALASERPISLRFKLVAATTTNTITLTSLTQAKIGALANNLLDIPETSGTRFTSKKFSLKVGSVPLANDNNHVKGVTVFSADPSTTVDPANSHSGAGWGIEYLTAASGADPIGRIKFGSKVISNYSSSVVWYTQEFLAAANLSSGSAEYNSRTGTLQLSAADLAAHAAEKTYFVQQMVTEERRDVSVSPLIGAFAFKEPVPKKAIVEAQYWQADEEGRKTGDEITEFLPVFLKSKEATRVKENVYQFNTDLDTVDTRIVPIVYIGSQMQNLQRIPDYTLEYPAHLNGLGEIRFVSKNLASYIKVKVTYAVYETQGGEKAYESSTKPVYRPPFFIKANQTQFGLRGDRTADFQVGQMIRLGETCHYLKSLTYFPSRIVVETKIIDRKKVQVPVEKGNVTGLEIFPPTVSEEGSRAPGNDVITVITAGPLTTIVDPDGTTPVATTAPAGFMFAVLLTQFPFEPVNTGQKTIIFQGDLTQFAIPGHILEVGGMPFTITAAGLNKDGTRTKITVASPFQSAFSTAEAPTIKLSYRPVYPPDATDFLGIDPIYQDETSELVLYGETDSSGSIEPGRTLIRGVEYNLDVDTGAVTLIAPAQEPLKGGQRLVLSFTRMRVLQPFWEDGVLTFPRYYGDFLYNTIPDTTNDLLGGTVTATYTFRSPDTFYCRIPTLQAFLAEAAEEAISEIASQSPAGGAFKPPASGSDNWDMGRLGFMSERGHLTDKDRAARTFLDFYNTAIVSFEQVLEAINGGLVGDRDHKFRFWIGRNKAYTPPGYEDEITGNLNIRNIFREIFNAVRAAGSTYILGNEIFLMTGDRIVEPDSLTLTGTPPEVEGDFPDSDLLDTMLGLQRLLVRNDVDDLVMTGGHTWITFNLLYPFFHLNMRGIFKTMGDMHLYSRLFPTQTRAFFRTFPGVDPDSDHTNGVYTWRRSVDDEDVRTHGRPIAYLTNPVLGRLDNVADADLSRRRARARIWAYLPNGLPAGAFNGGASGADQSPCVIAFPANLAEVPIHPGTGFPDEAEILGGVGGGGGEFFGAYSGDPELVVPGFAVGDQINWGKPTGALNRGLTPDTVSIFGVSAYTGLFVAKIQYGCVIFFQDKDGDALTSSDQILVGTGNDEGTLAHLFPIEKGDTIYVGPPIDSGDEAAGESIEEDMAVTPEQVADLAAVGMESYRTGFDLKVRSDGRVTDFTFPSFRDPNFFGFKEIFGQNPPDPVDALEGPVDFGYTKANPLVIPALTGGYQDDSGDNQIPYLMSANTEIDRFAQASLEIAEVMAADDPPGDAVYPDEVVANDGAVVAAVGAGHLASEPATLLTLQDMFPATTTPAARGVGDVARHDLYILQTDITSPFSTSLGPITGPEGVWSVGEVTTVAGGSLIEPPRFVTHTAVGSPIRYVAENALVFQGGDYTDHNPQVAGNAPGMRVIEDFNIRPGYPAGYTVFDFDSLGSIRLNDGTAVSTGNLNDIWAASLTNVITIKLFSRKDDDVVSGPAGPTPLPTLTNGELLLTIVIEGMAIRVTDYQGIPYVGVIGGAGPTFGDHEAPVPAAASCKQIILPGTGYIPWGAVVPPPGPTNQWFLPYTEVGAPVRRESYYGVEFTLSVDTVTGILVVAPGESTTAWVDEDRLTFNEELDFAMSSERGTIHPVSLLDMETRLLVDEVTVGDTPATNHWSSVNRYANGNALPFTFLPRAGHTATSVGTWTGALPGYGSLKVMAFEGWNNTSITGTKANFTAIPSNEQDEAGDICIGSGEMGSAFDLHLPATTVDRIDNRIRQVVETSGDISNVVAGDVVTVLRSANLTHTATTKAGTYVVRHAVDDNVAPGTYSDEVRSAQYTFGGNLYFPTSMAGSGGGWAPFTFPTVQSFTLGPVTVTFGPADANDFPAVGAGLLYFLISPADLISTDVEVRRAAVYSADIVSKIQSGTNVVITMAVLLDSEANPVAAATVQAAIAAAPGGVKVSGMTRIPINVSGENYGLPENNCVGHQSLADSMVYGFRWLSLVRPNYFTVGVTQVYDGFGGTPGIVAGVAPALGQVSVEAVAPTASNQYIGSQLTPVYQNVPSYLHLNINTIQWDAVHNTGFASTARFLLPGDGLQLQNGAATPGFFAQAGIFLEPSVPRAALNLDTAYPKVVDNTPYGFVPQLPLLDYLREIGTRTTSYYNPVPVVVPEQVSFTVKRIRRWHEVNTAASSNLIPLRYAYEIRRGRITAYNALATQRGVLTASAFTMTWETNHVPAGPLTVKAQDIWSDETGPHNGTNLGTFLNPDVGIKAGDLLRLLDSDGKLVDEVEIESVLSDSKILLAVPGLDPAVADFTNFVGMRFEVYLRNAPVPHEQSNEQLLDLITIKEVMRTDASWYAGTPQGGWVNNTGLYDDNINILHDSLNAPVGGGGFTIKGVAKDDIVIIDPAGYIPQLGTGLPSPAEKGTRPFGDTGVALRAQHVAGGPNPLDDNRGFYRVTKVDDSNPTAPALEVKEITTFTGTAAAPVVFAPANPDRAYAVYPTVEDSGINGVTKEGQMTLRPTKERDPVTGSFQVYTGGTEAFFSLQPLSFKVIRPVGLLTDEAIDLVLSIRERMLSWIEELRAIMRGDKGGSYFVFQRDMHAARVGGPTDPELGLGVMFNLTIESLIGEVGVAPYLNASDCLSMLDRRAWILDTKLDSLEPDPLDLLRMRKLVAPGPAYTAFNDVATGGGDIRPVLPDRVTEVLDSSDRLRSLRYTWLAYRTHRARGTLANILRFDREIPERFAERQRLLLLMESTEKA